MRNYELVCETCDATFAPLVADAPDELLAPDYETACEQTSALNTSALQSFHESHHGHSLKAVEVHA